MAETETLLQIPIDRIHPSRFQPRDITKDFGVKDMVESLRTAGQIQPVRVRPIDRPADADANDSGPFYELVVGWRRYMAAGVLGWSTISAVVKEMSDEEAAVWAMAENEQRRTLNPMERARGYQDLINEFQLTQEQVGGNVGLTAARISQLLNLLREPPEIQEMLAEGSLTEVHCRALDKIRNSKMRVSLAQRVVQNELSAAATQKRVDAVLKGSTRPKRPGTTKPAENLIHELAGFRLTRHDNEIEVRGRKFTLGRDDIDLYVEDLRAALSGAIGRWGFPASPTEHIGETQLPSATAEDWNKAAEALAKPLSVLSNFAKVFQNSVPDDPHKKT